MTESRNVTRFLGALVEDIQDFLAEAGAQALDDPGNTLENVIGEWLLSLEYEDMLFIADGKGEFAPLVQGFNQTLRLPVQLILEKHITTVMLIFFDDNPLKMVHNAGMLLRRD